jgi:hypothetical protein
VGGWRRILEIAFIALLGSGAAGCRFAIPGLSIDAGAQAGQATPPLTALDLAETQPGEAMDLALGPTPPTTMDMARPLSIADMANSIDMTSGCVHVNETFASDPTARWTLQGNATYDANNQRLQVTSPDTNVAGSAFYNQPLFTVAFDARFDFRINDGSGADGLAFVLARSGSVAGLGPFGNGQMNMGFGLGYFGMDGLAIELDTFQNLSAVPGQSDPDNNHVGFMLTAEGKHLLTGTPPAPPLHSGMTRTAHVRFTGAHVTVEIDGKKTLDGDVTAEANFNPGTFFFGFTGASGGITDRHTVTNFQLIVGPAGICF